MFLIWQSAHGPYRCICHERHACAAFSDMVALSVHTAGQRAGWGMGGACGLVCGKIERNKESRDGKR